MFSRLKVNDVELNPGLPIVKDPTRTKFPPTFKLF